jgi:hypothetical protein
VGARDSPFRAAGGLAHLTIACFEPSAQSALRLAACVAQFFPESVECVLCVAKGGGSGHGWSPAKMELLARNAARRGGVPRQAKTNVSNPRLIQPFP